MKAIVLSSGGVDSTTCLALAVSEYGRENVTAVSVYYGQKHKKELEAARAVAAFFDVPHYELDLSAVFAVSNCPLLAHSDAQIAHKSYAEQLKEDAGVETYVPFRNGLFLAAVASFAGGIYPKQDVEIYIGAHADDAAGNAYADCSEAFISAMSAAVKIGTYEHITIKAPFVGMNKAAVVAEGLRLGAPYELTWSCYEGQEKPCGVCGTCRDRAAAFAANGVKDPALR